MTGDKINPTKVDTTLLDIKYEDIPEESRKQFEAALQKEQEEAKKRLLACYGKTRQGVFEKDKHVEVYGDSLLVVQQVYKVCQCYNGSLNVYALILSLALMNL